MRKQRLKRRNKTVETVGVGTPLPNVFTDEVMTCPICGTQQQASPDNESGWTAIQLDDRVGAYFCPTCWHKIGQAHGYDNMNLIAIGIGMGSAEMLELAKKLVG